MSRNMAQGFSVSQPTFNSPLQFCPALGTQELDDLINAYVPGSASLQEKRTFVSMDFFNYSHATGESFRYYSVPSMATSSAESSPAQDSGYSSSFVSPALSNWSWPQAASTSASTPAVVSKKSPVSRASPPDFSNIPGMKIMTTDGRDVTNSASRGCKTKEQRDHAHLMRIIKACDACKKKKIRCDPSHKKRSSGATPAAQAPSQSTVRSKTVAKKTKQATPPPTAPSPPQSFPSADDASFFLDPAMVDLDLRLLEMDAAMAQDAWNSFIDFDESLATIPDNYDFFFDPAGHFSPISSVPAVQDASFSHVQDYAATSAPTPALPYMESGAAGTDYVDFNLFSPTSSFVDDESMPVNDTGMVSASDSYGTVREPAVSPAPLQQVPEHSVPGPRVTHGGQNVKDQQFVRRRDRPESNAPDGVVANTGASSPSLIGGVQNSGGTAVTTGPGQERYAPNPGQPQSVHLSTTPADADARRTRPQGASRGGIDDQCASGASRAALLLREAGVERSRLLLFSRGSSAVIATSERAGVDATVNQSTVAVPAVSSAVVAATRERTLHASVEVYATRATSAGVDNSGLIVESHHVTPSSPTTRISRGVGRFDGVPGAQDVEKVRRGLQQSSVQKLQQQPQQKPAHSVDVLIALGVLASGLPSHLVLYLVQFALGLLVLGSVFLPKAVIAELASSPEQRICGTTPLPSSSDQDEKPGPPSTAWQQFCPGGAGRPSAQHQEACRQMDHHRPISAVGRLAAFGLSRALTQWNI
jgi:hypothetical protein